MADTVARARLLAPEARIRILTGSHLVEPIRSAVPDLGPGSFLVEPRARGTGPVLVWAAWEILRRDPEAVIVSLHADHVIRPAEAFRTLLLDAAALARREGLLLTVAVPPTRPETGYGYIRPGEELPPQGSARGFRVASFVEKPDLETARLYVEDGFLWNSGLFLWRAELFLEEVRRVAPELGSLLPLLEQGDVEVFFARAPEVTVDVAVLERSDRVGSVRATFEWDDVGSWEALARTRSPDEAGNVLVGDVHAVEAEGNVVLAEEGAVALFGVEGLVVVRTPAATLVTTRERSAELKRLLAALPPRLRNPEGP